MSALIIPTNVTFEKSWPFAIIWVPTKTCAFPSENCLKISTWFNLVVFSDESSFKTLTLGYRTLNSSTTFSVPSLPNFKLWELHSGQLDSIEYLEPQ